ncbi:MAG TPA: hypothetical protein VF719_05565, partial [Abditibacteriaceae bacterium]
MDLQIWVRLYIIVGEDGCPGIEGPLGPDGGGMLGDAGDGISGLPGEGIEPGTGSGDWRGRSGPGVGID